MTGEGDQVKNGIRWYTLVSFKKKLNSEKTDYLNKFNARYHVTEEFLGSITRELFVQGASIANFLSVITTQYAQWAKNKWMNVNKETDLNGELIHSECQKFYLPETFTAGIKEYLLGYMHLENLRFETEVDKTIQTDYYADAANSTLKHTIQNYDNQRKRRTNTTELHIQNWQAILKGQFRILPNGSECYEIFLDELADIIKNNICTATKAIGGWSNYRFHHVFNIDRGTQANPNILRNGLIYKLKQKLGCNQWDTYYKNESTGKIFHFDQYYLRVGQELYHLVIRLRQAGAWNYQHSDCWAVIRAFTAVSKRLQYKYDKLKHPSLFQINSAEERYDPYKLYEQYKQLFDDRQVFDNMKKIIFAFLRLQGTRDYKLQQELKCTIHTTKLIVNGINVEKPTKFIADLLFVLFNKVTKNHIGQIEALFLFGPSRWKEIQMKDYFYNNEQDRANPNKDPDTIAIPFYTSNPYVHERFLTFINLYSQPSSQDSSTNHKKNLRCKLEDYPLNNNTPYVSYFAATAEWETQFQLYQERSDSIHAHPKQAHPNGRVYNDKKGGISRNAATYQQRDLWWTWKHALARGQACECNPFAIHHGANSLENIHNIVLKFAPQFANQPVYWGMIPAWQVMIKFGLNYRAVKSLSKQIVEKPVKYNHESIIKNNNDNDDLKYDLTKELENLHKIQTQTLDLAPLRKYKLDPKTNHGYLFWQHTERDMKSMYKGVCPSDCKGKPSTVYQSDKESLLVAIYDMNYEYYQKTRQNIDYKQMILDKDQTQIKQLKQKIGGRMQEYEIITFIQREIIDCDFQQEESDKKFDITEEEQELREFLNNKNDDVDDEIGKFKVNIKFGFSFIDKCT